MTNMKMRRNIQLSYIFLSGVNELSSVVFNTCTLLMLTWAEGYSTYCIVFIAHILQTFKSVIILIHSFISILYWKVPFLIVWRRNPMRID